ncbi:MAG TPA: DUF4157 domain-containing protein, partial [Longimicrobium sp.]|nr:DUF4157 domain-containing protein [Longimicrobium sp.]
MSDHLPAGRPGAPRPSPPAPSTPQKHADEGLPLFLRGGGGPGLSSAPLSVQRSPADGASTDAHVGVGPDEAAAAPEAARTPVPGLIVEDDAAELQPGQMRRGDFLALLRGEVCATAEDALRGSMWSSMGCPYVDRWFGHYAGQSAEHIERALRRYVPEAAGASDARSYVPLATARVRAAIAQWTGDENAPALPAAPGGEEGGGLLSSLAGMFFKARDGGARPESPAAVRAGLGGGRALDPQVAGRMGAAFGADFGHVRVHTGTRGESAAERMNARAFTVGEHVAFGAGEYRPGTPAGDALIAHELAHVVQQGGGAGGGAASGHALEEEADRAAVGAVVAGAAGGWQGLGALLPRLRGGLGLSRCSKNQKPSPTGTHYDQAVSGMWSGTPNEMLQQGVPGLTHDESAEHDEVVANLTTMNAGGSYVFFGHGAMDPADRRFKGVNPSSGKTVMGQQMQDALSSDANPPTLVVLGACGSSAILSNVTAGGVPVAVGFSQE